MKCVIVAPHQELITIPNLLINYLVSILSTPFMGKGYGMFTTVEIPASSI